MSSTDELTLAAEKLLQPTEVEAEAEQEEVTQDAPEPDEEAVEAEATEAEVDEDEADTSEDDEDVDEATDEDADDEEPQVETFRVKADGEWKEVTLDDLKRAYAGDAKIQKGMQEAAEMRKHSEQLYRTLEAEQAKFLQTVQQLQQTGFKQPPSKPSIDLLETDPFGYMQENARYEQEMQEYTAQQQQIQQMQERQAYMEQMAQQDFVNRQAAALAQEIPEFADPQKGPALRDALVKTAIEAYEFTPQEMEQVVDRRYVKVLRDAMKWRELQSGKAKAKKPTQPQKALKPTARRVTPQAVTRKKEVAKAKRSGKIEDFASLLLQPRKG